MNTFKYELGQEVLFYFDKRQQEPRIGIIINIYRRINKYNIELHYRDGKIGTWRIEEDLILAPATELAKLLYLPNELYEET